MWRVTSLYLLLLVSFKCRMTSLEKVASMFQKPTTSIPLFGFVSAGVQCLHEMTSSVEFTTFNVSTLVECLSLCAYYDQCTSSSFEFWTGECLVFYVDLKDGFCINNTRPVTYTKVNRLIYYTAPVFFA